MEARIKVLIVLLPLLFICTYNFVDYKTIINEIAQMAFGRLPAHKEFTILSGALNIMAICVLAIALAFLTLVLVIPMTGKRKTEISEFASLRGVNIVVFLEEVFARLLLFWLPLYLSGYNIIVFYIFWILSNGIWALMHLRNYEEHERSLWLVLPQFIGGLFIESYAFLKFGFWVAYAIHLFYDFILFASIGREELKSSLFRNLPSRAAGVGLGAFLIGVETFSFTAFSAAISQLPYLQWLDGKFIDANIMMFTFIGFLLIMVNVIGFVCDLSGMDESSVLNFLKQRSIGFFEKRIGWLLVSILGGILIPILLLIVYYLTSWILIPIINFFTPFQNIANATFLLSAFIISSMGRGSEDKKTSPSAEFRSFLVEFPLYFLLLVYMTKVPVLALFLSTIVFGAISGIVESLRLY
jgi:hypothetical protein